EFLEHLQPARGRADAAPLEQRREILLACRHAAILATMIMRTVIVLAATMLALSGCGGSPTTKGTLEVVAAENVYGNIAAQIGGSRVSVTSVLTDPTADPHLFEPHTSSGLAVAKAQ